MSYNKKMARTSYNVYEKKYPYFMTCSIVDWLPIFSIPAAVQLVLDSLIFLQDERDFKLYSYVVMENHMHLIARSDELQKCMREFKSFTARQIVDHLSLCGHSLYLRKLEKLKLTHHHDSDFQFWQEGYHPKQIDNDKIMEQKMGYIHNNPVKRGYVDQPEHWRYSSARNYAGEQALIPVTLVDVASAAERRTQGKY